MNLPLGNIVYGLYRAGTFLVPYRSRRVRCVVWCGSHVLLVTHTIGNGHWGLPGGGIQRNETPERAAVRELHEELSIEADSITSLRHVGTSVRTWGLSKFTFEIMLIEVSHLHITNTSYEIKETCKYVPQNIHWSRTDDLVKEALAYSKIKT